MRNLAKLQMSPKHFRPPQRCGRFCCSYWCVGVVFALVLAVTVVLVVIVVIVLAADVAVEVVTKIAYRNCNDMSNAPGSISDIFSDPTCLKLKLNYVPVSLYGSFDIKHKYVTIIYWRVWQDWFITYRKHSLSPMKSVFDRKTGFFFSFENHEISKKNQFLSEKLNFRKTLVFKLISIVCQRKTI